MPKAAKGKKQNRYVSDYVIFDLETTGTNPHTDEVIEISAIKIINRKIVEEFTSLVNPGRPIPYGATRINNITDAMVREAPSFSAVLKDFLAFAGDMVLVGHNIHTFDMKFLYRDAERFYGTTIKNDYIDTLTIARMYLPQLSHHRLADLAEYYEIPSEGAHRALNDCHINQKVFEKLSKEMEIARSQAGKKLCPRCGSILVKRSGKYGSFWGCGGYPECRYTQNIKSHSAYFL